jgi:methyl-galactoside transport system substrate-binding protein
MEDLYERQRACWFLCYSGFCVILVFGFVFTSCDTSTGGNGKTYVPTIGIILHDERDLCAKIVKAGFESKNNGKAILEFADSHGSQDTQNGQIDTFIAKKIDVIAVNLEDTNDITNINAIITRTKNADIPLVFFYQGAGNQSEVYDIMADQNELAALQGAIIVDYWKVASGADRNDDNKMQYVMVHGPEDSIDANIRKTKIIEVIEGAEITVDKLFDFDGAWWLDEERKGSIKALLQEKLDVEMIICGNDGMALGMIDVLKEIPYFADEDIPIVGIDGTADAIAAINEGKMLGTVFQDFETIGKVAFDICYDLGVGENIPNTGTGWSISTGKHVVVPSKKIVKE